MLATISLPNPNTDTQLQYGEGSQRYKIGQTILSIPRGPKLVRIASATATKTNDGILNFKK